MMRSAALFGALFVASVQGFQPMTSFHGRAFAPKAMSARCAAGVMAGFLAFPAWSTIASDPSWRSSTARYPIKAVAACG
jgi:hypothetical protein